MGKNDGKDINEMSKKEFLELPYAKWDEEYEFDSLVIIPHTKEDMHESGYRCMSFCAVKGDKPLFLLGGGSDVLHLGGIGGFGYDWLSKYKTCPKLVPPTGWSIDCIPKSGLLRIFCGISGLISGRGLSSFELFKKEEGGVR